MKKCPECGNPSYDGAPVCGNCGYKFPKQKTAAPKRENIFQEPVKLYKSSDEGSTIEILKENKLVIGIILAITIIVICGIVLSGSNNNTTSQSEEINQFSEAGFSFQYPTNWEQVNGTDTEHEGSVFFENANNTTIQYYNVTSDSTSLRDITQQRINVAQENGDYVDTVITITIAGRNASDIILENSDGDYTRYVSVFNGETLHVFRITGSSINAVNSSDINSVLDTVDIA